MPTSPVPVSIFTQEARDRIGSAIYLYGYLIAAVDWKRGEGHFTYSRISEDTGFCERTLRRWMDELRQAGEIATRKTFAGMRVKILNYGDIAVTRKVKQPAAPAAKSGPTNCPDSANRPSKSSRSMCPHPATRTSNSGLSNMNQILSQSNVQKSLQKQSSPHNVDEGGAARRPPGERGQDRELTEAMEAVSALGEEERAALMREVMEQMATSEQRYLRFLVKRNDQGELEPAGEIGARGVLREMGRAMRES